MRITGLAIVVALSALSGACAWDKQLKGQSIAAYCGDPKNADKDLCAVNGELGAVRSDLAKTDQTATEAKALAEQAQAEAKAASAQTMNCETVTRRRASTGSCKPGYQLVSCTQSRYTTNAGGLTPMRDINATQCRFASRVLEIKVRCCAIGAASEPEAPMSPAPQSKPPTS